ncbi:MAG: hypothetical protein PUD20_09125 [bacterium]|nr:hypothetical protein [bacterium]
MLCTLQKRENIYHVKSVLGITLIMLLTLGEAAMMIVLEKMLSITQPVPATHMITFLISTCITSIWIYLFQEIFTFLFENQLVALSIGLIGSFAGLFFLFFARPFQQFVLWSYYCVLQTIYMDWNPVTREIHYVEQPLSLSHLLLMCFLVVITYVAGRLLFMKKDL